MELCLQFSSRIRELHDGVVARVQAMGFRIDRFDAGDGLIVLLASGRLSGEHVDTLGNALQQESGALAIDLKNVSLVDGDAVQLLVLAESNGTELKIVRSISANGSTKRGQQNTGRIEQRSMGNQRSTFDSLEGRGMTMAIKDLIRSSWKPHAVLGDVDQGEIGTGKGDIARSIHEARSLTA